MTAGQFNAYAWPPREPDADRRHLMRDDDIREGRLYIPHVDIVDAVNVARALGKPLLVVREPGTGKTRLAASIAWQLGLAGPFKFVAKSQSTARDLFYGYDALARFYVAQTQGQPLPPTPGPQPTQTEERRALSALDFIEYAALGKAILRALPRDKILPFLPPSSRHSSAAFFHPDTPQQSVVVIDEIDKAPRDFANDLLDEIDNLSFRVPELHPDLSTPPIAPHLRPIIVVTSNQERQLPDAFLRRCVFMPIPFPPRRQKDGAPGYTIDEIVDRHVTDRLGRTAGDPLFNSAIGYFETLRDARDLQKRPATAELLDWIVALVRAGCDPSRDLREQPGALMSTLSALAKTELDRTRAINVAETWLTTRPPSAVRSTARA